MNGAASPLAISNALPEKAGFALGSGCGKKHILGSGI
jgi:hypothetical protein